MTTELTRADAVMVGLACGDALGRPVEFQTPARIDSQYGEVTDMLGHGTHGQPAGTVTDDTQLAVHLAKSLTDAGHHDPIDVAARYVEWYRDDPFDIGLMTAEVLRSIAQGAAPLEAGHRAWEARPEGQNAGNGSVMRCAPLALAYGDDPDLLVAASRKTSAITHYDPRCQYGCAVLNLTLANLLRDRPAPLSRALNRVRDDAPAELLDALSDVPDAVAPSDLQTGGYVVTTLQTALYHGLTAETTRNAIITAVNRGGDADTIGAIAGAVAGARCGDESLPDSWISTLTGVSVSELRELTTSLSQRTFPQVD